MKVALLVALASLCLVSCSHARPRFLKTAKEGSFIHEGLLLPIEKTRMLHVNGGTTLTASPSKLDSSDGHMRNVEVQWTGVENPSPTDFVAVSCGAEKGISDFLDYRLVQDQLGSGSLTFNGLVNMRCSYVFHYIQANAILPNCESSVKDCSASFGEAACSRYMCPSGCQAGGHWIWGTTNYTYDSGICRAAIHVGLLDDAGGALEVEFLDDISNFEASTHHGITSLAYSSPNYPAISIRKASFEPQPLALLAEVAVDWTEGPVLPMFGRISLTSSHEEMRVMWTSGSYDHKPAEAVVQYGNRRDSLSHTVTGDVRTYRAEDICGAPSNFTAQSWFRDPGWTSDVVLTGLAAGDTVYYRYGSSQGWSDIHLFRMPPLVKADSGVNLVAYGDLGVYRPTMTAVMDDIDQYDALLHYGDISYARGAGYLWEEFMHMIQPVAQEIPYLVSVGNHEYDHVVGGQHDPSHAPDQGFHPSWGNFGDDSSGECAVPMVGRFHMPDNGNGLFWYSVNIGNTHVVQMSSEHDFTPSSAQHKWLVDDLASVDRAATPWVVLTLHRPLYCSQHDDGAMSDVKMETHIRDALEGALKGHVDIVFAGHFHSYERTCPVFNGKCDDVDGIVHVTAGSAGLLEIGPFGGPDYPWSVASAVDYGFSTFSTNATHAVVRFIRASDTTVLDEFVLSK